MTVQNNTALLNSVAALGLVVFVRMLTLIAGYRRRRR